MRILRVSKKAEAELVDIITSLSDFSQNAATKLYGAVIDKYDRLLEWPFMGPVCDHIKPGWRFFSVDGTYLIFYRVTDEVVEILHVVHGMRDLVRLYMYDD